MAPIRVGLIGLGPKGTGEFAYSLWSAVSHLPSIQALPQYELVAVANSTVESAKRSIASHALPSTVKAYGSPEDIANDPNVDLVVISVYVGKHLRLAKPAILAKKDIIVEWPLGASLAETEELAELAKGSGAKVGVAAQGHASKISLKLKELVAILHSFIDVLGNFSKVQAVMKTQFPDIPIVSSTGQVVNPSYTKTSPDDIFVQGILENGALASINFFKSETPVTPSRELVWRITGTEGEIEFSSPEHVWQFGHPQAEINVRIGKDGEPTKVELDPQGAVIDSLPQLAQNIALVYEAFAEGDTDKFPTFEKAAETHRLLQRILDVSGFEA
ncbi:uncharacterized protein DNG_09216 [Cephalotrichum gorgonifer]|uniref:Gfo/Idh/MocA-like oxidoreductase N-terminal domain-containing protein n=1 Tax=Cephalotrichum gorgonifer TaxID=2041049 RepID=A0AAE8SZ33_9PEZI|nr:uncharacterized protein DNG_09216 [Cephalotrichum gorgonifer]